MEYLIGLVALLVGGLLFKNSKLKSAESLLTNQKTKEEVQKIQAEQDKNNASLQLEEERRTQAEVTKNEKINQPVPDDELISYFLNRKK